MSQRKPKHPFFWTGVSTARLRPALIAVPAAGLILGLVLRLLGLQPWPDRVWAVGTLPVLAWLVGEILMKLRRGDVGLDIVAAVSMSAALAFGEHLAAIVVALMYAGGQYLEDFAERRARRDMTAVLARAPRSAMRHADGGLEEVGLDAIAVGDRLLVRQGDVAPVDGAVADGLAVLDQSALTGESIPVQRRSGEAVLSGSVNVGAPFDLRATRLAAESTYAGIVRLVEAAQHSKAPISRLADRFALGFLAVTLALAGGAWLFTGDPIRAVAVLVIATPCPLILAVPVAIVSGLSRAAKRGILIKSGAALETMAQVRSIVIDKTGTLTSGHARLVAIDACAGLPQDEILRLAASLDQASKHVVAQTLVAEARSRGLPLAVPTGVVETPGEGIEGIVDERDVIVGGTRFVTAKLPGAPTPRSGESRKPGVLAVTVAVGRRMAGTLLLADELRSGVQALLTGLKRHGVERIVLATGDRRDVAESITAGLPIDSVQPELTPDRKVLVVLSERKHGPVMMIGDGVNDAPALAAADVGLAMGAGGAAAAAEVADVILVTDQLDRVLPAIEIARRSRRLALESVYAGMGLSIAGMVAAALGHITPVEGALLQEVIDVAVILNALRALGEGRRRPVGA
jgi:heavy metal translocating P-type ATPase